MESYSDNTKDEYTLQLRRQGHRVDGILTCVSGPDEGSAYELTGSFKNLILTATYVSQDRRALDRGTWTIKLTENGMAFEGCGAYYSPEHDFIESRPPDIGPGTSVTLQASRMA